MTEPVTPTVDDLITLSEATALGLISKSHLRRLARDGKIWSRKLGREWVTTNAAINAYLTQERKPGPKANPNKIDVSGAHHPDLI